MTVRINLKEAGSVTEKVALLSHLEIQARKAARRLRTALAKWNITRKGIDGAVDGKAATVQPLATELIKWVQDAIDWSKTADLDAKPEPKKKAEKKVAAKKAAKTSKAKVNEAKQNLVDNQDAPPSKKAAKKADAKAPVRAEAQLKAKQAAKKAAKKADLEAKQDDYKKIIARDAARTAELAATDPAPGAP
jgi:hypothetical protein